MSFGKKRKTKWAVDDLVRSAVDAFEAEPEFLVPNQSITGIALTVGLFRREFEGLRMTTAMTFGLSRTSIQGVHSEFVMTLPEEHRGEMWALGHLLQWASTFSSGDRAIKALHTLATEDHPPLVPGSELAAWLVMWPFFCPESVRGTDGLQVDLLELIPITKREHLFAVDHGSAELVAKLEQGRVVPIVDQTRSSTV